MRSAMAFVSLCSAVTFTVGCNLSDINGSGGGSGGGGVAERSAYSIVESWDGEVATMEDGIRVIVLDGTFQRDSCSYGGEQNEEFLANVRKGMLAFYRVYITNDFDPLGEPLVANQFTLVNLECFIKNPTTCGVPTQ